MTALLELIKEFGIFKEIPIPSEANLDDDTISFGNPEGLEGEELDGEEDSILDLDKEKCNCPCSCEDEDEEGEDGIEDDEDFDLSLLDEPLHDSDETEDEFNFVG